jgi:moderate conductance mechanosensitive channel
MLTTVYTTVHTLVWPLAVILIALATGYTVSRLLARIRDARLARIPRINPMAVPVGEDAPMDNPNQTAKQVARTSVRNRFSIMSRGAMLLLITLGLLVAVFPFLGDIPQTMLSVVTAIAAAVVGIAARPLVENIFAGVVMSLSQQIRLGDTVMIDDKYGTVEDITMTHTVIKVWDWRRYVVPNSAMLNKEIENFSHRDHYLWATVVFSVDYHQDLDEIEELALAAATASEHFRAAEEPQLWVWDLAADRVTCWLAAWAESPQNAWYLKADMRRRLVRSFRDRGVQTHRQVIEFPNNPDPTNPPGSSASV